MRILMWCLILGLFLAGPAGAKIICVTAPQAALTLSADDPRSPVVLVAPRYYPLFVEKNGGSKYLVRDYRGRTGWVKSQLLAPEAGVVVTVPLANVRQGPGLENKLLFKAKEGVSFKVLERQGDWLQVHHESGRNGWIHRNLVRGRTH